MFKVPTSVIPRKKPTKKGLIVTFYGNFRNVSQMQNTVHKVKFVRKKVFVDMMATNVL